MGDRELEVGVGDALELRAHRAELEIGHAARAQDLVEGSAGVADNDDYRIVEVVSLVGHGIAGRGDAALNRKAKRRVG